MKMPTSTSDMMLQLCQLDQVSAYHFEEVPCWCALRSYDWQHDTAAGHQTTILQCLGMRSDSSFLVFMSVPL